MADARSGDRFMFYCEYSPTELSVDDADPHDPDAGHGQQIESMSKNEDDGFDEGAY